MDTKNGSAMPSSRLLPQHRQTNRALGCTDGYLRSLGHALYSFLSKSYRVCLLVSNAAACRIHPSFIQDTLCGPSVFKVSHKHHGQQPSVSVARVRHRFDPERAMSLSIQRVLGSSKFKTVDASQLLLTITPPVIDQQLGSKVTFPPI